MFDDGGVRLSATVGLPRLPIPSAEDGIVRRFHLGVLGTGLAIELLVPLPV